VAILPLVEDYCLKWSHDKYNTERDNMLRFRIMVLLIFHATLRSH